MAPARRENSFIQILKGIYNNEFQWNFIKSIGFFGVGVHIASSMIGMEIMPAVTH